MLRQVTQPRPHLQRELVGVVPYRSHLVYFLYVLLPEFVVGLVVRLLYPGGVTGTLHLEHGEVEEVHIPQGYREFGIVKEEIHNDHSVHVPVLLSTPPLILLDVPGVGVYPLPLLNQYRLRQRRSDLTQRLLPSKE